MQQVLHPGLTILEWAVNLTVIGCFLFGACELIQIFVCEEKHWNNSFILSIGVCRMQRFFAFLRRVLHSSLLCTFSCHPSPPTFLPSSLTSSCHLFFGLPLNLVVSKFIYNNLLGILIFFFFILCTCPNQRNLFNLTASITLGFLKLA